MDNLGSYNAVFVESFGLTPEQLNEGLAYQSIPAWDSVGHMLLVNSLEETFDIMLDTDDIIDFSSYETGKNILAKYGVEL